MSLPSPSWTSRSKLAVSRRGQLVWRLFGGLLAVLLGALILVVAAYNSGAVVGVEFSPVDFRRREFNYIRPSWLPVTLQGIRYRSLSDPAADYLREQQWLTAEANAGDPRWDLVWDNRMPADSSAYDARILLRYLDREDPESSGSWVISWSNAHPNLAAVVWPAVARVAREGSYFLIPEMLDTAAGWTGTTEELQRRLLELSSIDSPDSATSAGIAADGHDPRPDGEHP